MQGKMHVRERWIQFKSNEMYPLHSSLFSYVCVFSSLLLLSLFSVLYVCSLLTGLITPQSTHHLQYKTPGPPNTHHQNVQLPWSYLGPSVISLLLFQQHCYINDLLHQLVRGLVYLSIQNVFCFIFIIRVRTDFWSPTSRSCRRYLL